VLQEPQAYADFNADAATVDEPVEAGDDEVDERILSPQLPGGLNLGYTINLHLPAASDVAVFNAIFKSLREHLLRHGLPLVRTDAAGRESWYGQWRSGDALVKRKLGAKRRAGEGTGLTKAQAEAELRRRIEAERPSASPHERPSVEEAGRRYLNHLASVGRKRSTLMDYESHLRVHLAPFFSGKPLHRIEPRDVEAFIAAKRRDGRAPKSVLNYLGLLHSIFEFGQRRGWTASNPCKLVDKPRVGTTDADIRFLDEAERGTSHLGGWSLGRSLVERGSRSIGQVARSETSLKASIPASKRSLNDARSCKPNTSMRRLRTCP
jgi:hypothetical protein